ncbi:MAG: hypothetical protein LBQ88_14575 [Treponema sp.]|nr:hypothetical protein [Treponema sp.]
MYHTMSNDVNTANGMYLTSTNNITTLTRLFSMHGIPLPAGFPDSTATFWRFDTTPPGETVTTTPHNINIHTINFDDGEDLNMIRLSYAEDMDHAHYVENAKLAWDFLSQFSRNPTTKVISQEE